MEAFLLFSIGNSLSLALEVAAQLKLRGIINGLSNTSYTRFADDEFKIKSEDSVRGKDTFIIASTNPPAENLLELLMLIDSLKRASAKTITVIIPYYGYARQDKKPFGREPITAKMIAKLLEQLGIHRVVCIDLHADQIQGFFDIPVDNLRTHLLFAKALAEDFPNANDLVIVSPDTGGVTRVRNLSRVIPGSSYTFCEKERDMTNPDKIIDSDLKGKVEGKCAVVYDDITSTCHSLINAVKQLKNAGAKEVSAAVIHYACSNSTTDKIILEQLPIKKMYTTNTNPRSEYAYKKGLVTLISVADLLAETIIKITENGSVSELFEIK